MSSMARSRGSSDDSRGVGDQYQWLCRRRRAGAKQRVDSGEELQLLSNWSLIGGGTAAAFILVRKLPITGKDAPSLIDASSSMQSYCRLRINYLDYANRVEQSYSLRYHMC